MLTAVSAALGVALAGWFVRLLVALAPTSVPRLEDVSIDGQVVFFTIAVSLICALVFGGVPAWHVLHQQRGEQLKEGGRGSGPGPGRRRVQRALVVLQVALTFLLVCGAGLLARSLAEVERAPLGFETRGVLILRMVVPEGMSEPARGAFYREVTERARLLPGVSRIGIISNVLTTSTPNATVRIEGRSGGIRVQTPIADDSASPELFSALHAPLRSGRFFSDDDTAQSPLVAIVNDTFAREFWSGERPVGRRFQFLDGRFDDRWVTVVGVVGDMRRDGREHDPFPQVFVPFAQSPSRGADAVILTRTPPLALAASIRQAIAGINPNVPVYRISTLEQRIDAFLTARRFQVTLLSCFAVAALVLAAVGIYGLMRYMVVQRTAEIAVRVAMGATRSRVVGLVLRETLALTCTGLVMGALLALAIMSSVHSLLYGVSPGDPVTFILAPAVLVIVAIVASVEPTWRAMRIDPMTSLRAG